MPQPKDIAILGDIPYRMKRAVATALEAGGAHQQQVNGPGRYFAFIGAGAVVADQEPPLATQQNNRQMRPFERAKNSFRNKVRPIALFNSCGPNPSNAAK